MARDKLISVRVSSSLIDRFNVIVASKTQVEQYAGRNLYSYEGRRPSFFNGKDGGKYTIADLLEAALEEYIQKNT